MVDFNHHTRTASRWVCPDDRQLILRSRLGAGWSYWTAEQESLTHSARRVGNEEKQLSDDEERIVTEVLERAAAVDRDEEERIGRLVVRLEQLKKAACFDGVSRCAVCGERLGILSRSSTICSGCKKGVCQSCSAKTTSDGDAGIFLLCKVCLEEREVWKKTGAWFYNMLPPYVRPSQRAMPLSRSPTPDRIIRTWSQDDLLVNGPSDLDKDFNPRFLSTQYQLSSGSRRGFHSSSPNLSHREFDADIQTPHKHRNSKAELNPSGFGVDIPMPKKSQTSRVSLESVGTDCSRKHSHMDRVATEGLVQAAKQARRFSLSRDLSSDKDKEISGDSDSLASPVIPRLPSDTSSFSVLADKKKPPKGDRVKAFGTKGKRSYGNELDGGGIEDEEEDVDKLLEQIFPKESESLSGTSSPRRMDSAPGLGYGKGTIHFSLLYNAEECELRVQVIKCKSLAIADHSGPLNPFVRTDLLPTATKSREMKSPVMSKTSSPTFQHLITYPGILESDIKLKTLRLCVMHAGRLGHELSVGEARVPLKKLKPGVDEKIDHVLEKLTLQPSDTVTQTDDRGVIQVSLEYVPDKSQLMVGILQAAGLAPMDRNGLSDPYVKCYLRPDPHKKSKHKTVVIKKTLNPKFNTEFTYEMKPGELAKKTLEITVWDHDLGKNDYIGGIQLNREAKGSLLLHWHSVLTKNQKLVKWHKLSPNQFVEK